MCAKIIRFGLFVLLATSSSFRVHAQLSAGTQFSRPPGYVCDYGQVFTREQIHSLDSLLRAFEMRTGNELVVVGVSYIFPYETLNDYSLDLFSQWRIGKNDKDNGLLIAFKPHQNLVRIQVGVGLKQHIDSLRVEELIHKIILPEFENLSYYSGIRMALLSIIADFPETEINSCKWLFFRFNKTKKGDPPTSHLSNNKGEVLF